MDMVRAFFLRHRLVAIALVVAALCMKALVPGGYMLGESTKVLTVQICHDGTGAVTTKQIAIPMKGGASDTIAKQGKGECPFSALSMASLSGADPILLALALGFILLLGLAPVHPAPHGLIAHLRPPLRGPPALA